MISSDLAPAAPSPVPSRGARPAEATAPEPEQAFEAFVDGAPADEPKPAVDLTDLAALLDASPPAAPAGASPTLPPPTPPSPTLLSPTLPSPTLPSPDAAAAALVVVAAPALVATLAGAEAGEPSVGRAAAQTPDTIPAPPVTPTAPVATAPAATPVVAGLAQEVGEAPPPEAEGEVDPEARIPSAAPSQGPTPGAAEARPIPAGPAQAGFDLALQPAPAQSWRLSAASVEAAHARASSRVHAPSPRDVVGQITVAIAQSSQPQLEIRLDPPELGRVQIRLNPTEHGLQALVLADRPETQDFLRRHAETLVRDLGDAGYANVSLDFAAGQEAAPRDAPPDERQLTATFAAPEAAPTQPRPAARTVAAGGLDIRL